MKIDHSGVQFFEYMPGQNIFHYNHLVVATKIQFDIVPKKGRRKPKWRLDIEEHEKSMGIIKDREDPNHMYKKLSN
jgi:hypothetical protein